MVQQIENEYDDECLWFDTSSPSRFDVKACMESSVMKDALGLTWCEEHSYRGRLINWGAQHGWPELRCPHPYRIGPGDYCWAMAVKSGTDDFIGLAVATTELLDEQEVA
jgi:hypothetical protein